MARVDGPALAPPRKAPVKALIAGLGGDIGGSLFAGIVLTFVYGAVAIRQGQTPEEIAETLKHLLPDSWLYIFSTTIGAVFSFAGGYVCARVAGQQETRLGIIQSICSVAFGLYVSARDLSLGTQIALSGCTVLVIMLGIRLGAARNRRGLA